MKLKYRVLFITLMIFVLTSCNVSGPEANTQETDEEPYTNEIVHQTENESVVSSEDSIDMGGAESPCRFDSLEIFLSEWEAAHNGTKVTDPRMLSDQYDDGQYYVVVPVVTNSDYELRVNVYSIHYCFLIVPNDRVDTVFDYKTGFLIFYDKNSNSYEYHSEKLAATNGLIKDDHFQDFDKWTTSRYERELVVYTPNGIEFSDLEQYFTFETYTLVNGEITRVD